jgi:Mor family transcriptional regulator
MPRLTKPQLLKLQKELKTDAAIGKKFGISRQAIHQLRQKYRVPYFKNKNQQRDTAIVSAYKKGQTGVKIAKKFKLSASQAYRIIARLNRRGKKSKKR